MHISITKLPLFTHYSLTIKFLLEFRVTRVKQNIASGCSGPLKNGTGRVGLAKTASGRVLNRPIPSKQVSTNFGPPCHVLYTPSSVHSVVCTVYRKWIIVVHIQTGSTFSMFLYYSKIDQTQ